MSECMDTNMFWYKQWRNAFIFIFSGFLLLNIYFIHKNGCIAEALEKKIPATEIKTAFDGYSSDVTEHLLVKELGNIRMKNEEK